MAVAEDLSWADAYPGPDLTLGEIFCLTFVRGVAEGEALRRMGALPDTVATRTWSELGDLHNFDDGYPMVAAALSLGEWTVVFEPNGFEGAHLTEVVSRGGEAVSVLRHDYASPAFEYAVDGELIIHFDPTFPADRYGADADRLLTAMHEVGFVTGEDDDNFDDNFNGAIERCLLLTERLIGVLPTFDALTGPLTSAHLEPWFADAPKQPAGRGGPVDPLTEVRQLTGQYDLTDTPGLADALAAVERAEPVTVTPDSPLGGHVRAWLTEARRASWSLNDHSARMREAERRRAFDLGRLAQALGAVLRSDS